MKLIIVLLIAISATLVMTSPLRPSRGVQGQVRSSPRTDGDLETSASQIWGGGWGPGYGYGGYGLGHGYGYGWPSYGYGYDGWGYGGGWGGYYW